ncbi:LPS export ABC transporter permease LptF [Comamonas jiangduensis]|jgi:lipopolysaccharide export system permease protein|uniref:LPS export ABC transporter permease LptF n=1 Tax=Comamonas jiangduensis TaxID=1194168 RepID=UPI001581CA56|nr:LPS export ABC transporter permease LptF [Comamonas jiangduensis]
MLFDSSIRKELGRSFGATLVVLITVVMTMMLIRTLGQATKGTVSPSDVMLVMGFTVLGQLSTILTLSLFVAVVGTLSRMYRDSEMSIWFASGQGLASQLKPILRFAWPIVAVIAVLGLLVWPWSNQQIQELRSQFEQRSDIDRIAPGEFQESSDGTRVIFIDKDSVSQESASNIFLVEQRQGREFVTSSKTAQIQTVDGVRNAVLTEGQRVETDQTTGQIKLTHFDSYTLRLEDSSPAKTSLTARAISTPQLLQNTNPVYLAEAGWRAGLPLAALNLLVLALAITIVNPRAGQSTSLVVALLAFVVYYNLMNMGQSWVASGRMSLGGYLLGIHGSIFAIAALGLAIRHHRWHIKDLWQRRGVTA